MRKTTWSIVILFAFVSLTLGVISGHVEAQTKARTSSKTQQGIARQPSQALEPRCIIGRDAVLNDPSLSREQIKTYLDYIDKDKGFVFDRNGMLDVLSGSGGSAAACDDDCNWCCCDSNGQNCRCC